MNPQFTKKIKIYKNFIIFAAVDIICALILFVYVIPAFTSIPDSISKIRTQSQENDKLKNKVRFLNDLDYDQLSQNIDLVLEVLPVEKSIPAFIATLDTLTSANGIMMEDFSISNVGDLASSSGSIAANDKQARRNSIIAQVSLASTMENFISFMNRIASILKIIHMINLSLTFSSEQEAEMKTDIATYFAPLPTKLDKLDKIDPFTDQEEMLLQNLKNLESLRQAYEIPPLDSQAGGKTNPFSQ